MSILNMHNWNNGMKKKENAGETFEKKMTIFYN